MFSQLKLQVWLLSTVEVQSVKVCDLLNRLPPLKGARGMFYAVEVAKLQCFKDGLLDI